MIKQQMEINNKFLEDKIHNIMKEYQITYNFPAFIFDDNTNYYENIYDKMVDCLVILSTLITTEYLTEDNIKILISDYDDELATLRLISQTEHYKECELYLIYKIFTTKELLIQNELFESVINFEKFIKITEIEL